MKPGLEFLRSGWRLAPRAFLLWTGAGLLGAIWTLALAGCGAEPAVASIPKAGAAAAKRLADTLTSAASANAITGMSNAVPQSVFHAGLDARNPFFPNLNRRQSKTESGDSGRLPLEGYLKLVGIRSGTARPMALINRTPFAQGEDNDVSIVVTNELSRAEVKKVNIRCLEIRRDSVLISINGEQGVKELRMAQGR